MQSSKITSENWLIMANYAFHQEDQILKMEIVDFIWEHSEEAAWLADDNLFHNTLGWLVRALLNKRSAQIRPLVGDNTTLERANLKVNCLDESSSLNHTLSKVYCLTSNLRLLTIHFLIL